MFTGTGAKEKLLKGRQKIAGQVVKAIGVGSVNLAPFNWQSLFGGAGVEAEGAFKTHFESGLMMQVGLQLALGFYEKEFTQRKVICVATANGKGPVDGGGGGDQVVVGGGQVEVGNGDEQVAIGEVSPMVGSEQVEVSNLNSRPKRNRRRRTRFLDSPSSEVQAKKRPRLPSKVGLAKNKPFLSS